jgi:hypothetical protein
MTDKRRETAEQQPETCGGLILDELITDDRAPKPRGTHLKRLRWHPSKRP